MQCGGQSPWHGQWVPGLVDAVHLSARLSQGGLDLCLEDGGGRHGMQFGAFLFFLLLPLLPLLEEEEALKLLLEVLLLLLQR